jgi:regulator of sigma E protease
MVLVNILVFLISLSVVIILHELGHFYFARKAGILCHEFSIGMGPVLWKTKKGETTYSIRAIPIGGYVMMAGEEVDGELVKVSQEVRLVFEGEQVKEIILDIDNPKYDRFPLVKVQKVDLKGEHMSPLYINQYSVLRDAFYVMKKQKMQIAPSERSFAGKSLWQRFKTIFGGPLMNFVLAFIVFIVVNLLVGFPNFDEAKIGIVGDGYPAAAYLEPGDVITKIEGVPISTWDDLDEQMQCNISNRQLDITVSRNQQDYQYTLVPTLYFFNVGLHSDENTVDQVIVGSVPEGTFASKIGIEEGDEILYVNERPINTWDDFVQEMYTLSMEEYDENRVTTFTVKRGDETIILSNQESKAQPYSAAFLKTQHIDVVSSKIGISPEYSFSVGKSVLGGLEDVKSSASIIFTTIGLLFDNKGAGANVGVDDLAGPLGIYEITSQALSQGFVSLLSWIGLLSVNLGVVNLLPIPALDGGRLVFILYEAIFRRKPNQKIENSLHYVMYIALLGLFVFITFNDLLRLFNLK